MKNLKPGEWSDDHGGPEAWELFCRDRKIAELEAALAEAVALMRFMCNEQCIEHDRDVARSRMSAFLDKHGGEGQ